MVELHQQDQEKVVLEVVEQELLDQLEALMVELVEQEVIYLLYHQQLTQEVVEVEQIV
jgi:hypothetical protein